MELDQQLIPVTEWAVANEPAPDLIYRRGMWDQVKFVRDDLAGLLCPRIDHTIDEYRDLVKVCGTHRSKSVLLPVFSIESKRGFRLTMRNNFHDWGVSVEVTHGCNAVTWDFDRLADPNKVDSYCEGFPPNRKFGTFAQSSHEFTVGLQASDYNLYTFVYLLMRQFPHKA